MPALELMPAPLPVAVLPRVLKPVLALMPEQALALVIQERLCTPR